MFKCGDKVIYKSFGVCTIEQTDYVLESMNSKGGDVPPRLYFVLKRKARAAGRRSSLPTKPKSSFAPSSIAPMPSTLRSSFLKSNRKCMSQEHAYHRPALP